MKPILIFLFVFVSTNSAIISQNKDFVVGAAIGFYGVHIEGDINEMYSSSNGTFWGHGGLSIALNVKRDFTKNVYGTFELRAI